MSAKLAEKVISDIEKEWTKVLGGLKVPDIAGIAKDPGKVIEFLVKGGKYDEAAKQMSTFWNKMVGNSWAATEPRDLILNKNLQGTLQSTFGRHWITPKPLKDDTVTVNINERGGKAKTEVTIYKISPGGRPEKLRTWWFNDETQDKKDKSEDRSATFHEMKGRLLMIELDPKSLLDKFAYTIRVNT